MAKVNIVVVGGVFNQRLDVFDQVQCSHSARVAGLATDLLLSKKGHVSIIVVAKHIKLRKESLRGNGSIEVLIGIIKDPQRFQAPMAEKERVRRHDVAVCTYSRLILGNSKIITIQWRR
jgi:hypothetical protein